MIDSLLQLERVTADFRRGLPVFIRENAAADTGVMAIAAETLEDDALATCRAHGDPQLLLTHNRAKTLKIRLYTPDIVVLPLAADKTAEWVHRTADPAFDLDQPLQGPFDASRTAPDAASIASIGLSKLAGLLPAAVTVPMTRESFADAFEADDTNLLKINADAISNYDRQAAFALKPIAMAQVPLAESEDTRLFAFRPADGGPEHLAIVIGDPTKFEAPLVRLHSECFTGDLIGSLKCDCGDQLRGAIKAIADEGGGIVLYLAQEGRGIGLMNKLRAYALQDKGFDTVEANERLGFEVDERLFSQAKSMLTHLGLSKIRLLTNNPDKVDSLKKFGINITERVPHQFPSNEHNWRYLDTKKHKTGHLL